MFRKYFFLIALVSLIVGWQLLRVGYYPMHDDLQVMRLYQMQRCLKDGQIPCRWAPDMGNNYGQPLFNFYSALPYYLGGLLNLVGFSLVDTVKLLFLLSLLVSGIFVFLLASLFLTPAASLVAAVSYMVAPYHALDIFVRGALSESWGLSIIPAVIYFLFKYLKSPDTKTGLALSLSGAALLTTHNLTTIMNLPILICSFIVGTIIFRPSLRAILKTVLFGILGFGLASFFVLPVLVEKSLIQTKFLTADYFQYEAHFVTLRQLFLKDIWGYGPSKFGTDDDLSFYLGFWQILGLIFGILVSLKFFIKRNFKLLLFSSFWIIVGWVSLFLTHNRSTPIWLSIPSIAIVQFPWRFLGPAILAASISLGFVFENLLNQRLQKLLTLVVCFCLVIFNFRFFTFEKYFYWIDDQQKLSGELYNLQVRAAVLDYLPKTSQKIPESKASSSPTIKSGRVDINYFDNRSNYFGSEFDVAEEALIEFPVMYFPEWTIYLDRNPQPAEFSYNNDLGLITVSLSRGHHLVQGFFENTPVRLIGNVMTFTSILIILFLYKREKSKD